MSNKYENNIEKLVASYASVGRRHRRNRFYSTIAATVAALLLILVGLQAWQFGGDRVGVQRSTLDKQAQEIAAIKNSLATEIAAINAQRREFERSRQLLLEQGALLETEIGAASKQRRKLEEQRQEFAAQQGRLAQSIDEIDDRRQSMRQRRAELERQDPLVESERAAMNEERRKLEQRRKQYAEEGALLEKEIEAINMQRAGLAAQRVEVEKARKELQALLDKSKNMRNTTTKVEPNTKFEEQSAKGTEPAQQEPEREIIASTQPAQQGPNPLGLPIVEAYQLEKTRGGFAVGDDMVISVGITRSASVNGVEQFSNALHIADLVSGITPAEMENVTSTLVQNGPGNYVSPNVLAQMSGNFSTILQNSLDGQEIATKNVYDISVDNVSNAMDSIAAGRAVNDALAIAIGQ